MIKRAVSRNVRMVEKELVQNVKDVGRKLTLKNLMDLA
jgi:hypothetical protein